MPWLLTREFSCSDFNWRDRILRADKSSSESFMYEDICGKKIQSLENSWGLCVYLFIYLFNVGNTCRCFSLWETGCLLGHNRKQLC